MFYSDVAQDRAQQPIFDIAKQVHIRGPFKANWVKGESLKADVRHEPLNPNDGSCSSTTHEAHL